MLRRAAMVSQSLPCTSASTAGLNPWKPFRICVPWGARREAGEGRGRRAGMRTTLTHNLTVRLTHDHLLQNPWGCCGWGRRGEPVQPSPSSTKTRLILPSSPKQSPSRHKTVRPRGVWAGRAHRGTAETSPMWLSNAITNSMPSFTPCLWTKGNQHRECMREKKKLGFWQNLAA